MDVRWGVGISSRGRLSTKIFVGNFLGALWLVCLGCLFFSAIAEAQSSICAEVKIQINQRVSFERQAFDAMLRIRNGLEGIQVERIEVNLSFKDLEDHESSGLFFQKLDTTAGITGSVEDGTGAVAASSTGEAHWLIIPAAGAGGTSGKGYQIGATVTYRMTGETADRTVEVTPEIITVRPQPRLTLDYFLPNYVYADDPLTPEVVEPTIPFTLGVRIANTGYGIASHTTIESAQPQIVQNDQGLLIDFQIIGSYVDDRPAQPSLLIDFGDIAPGQSRMGRWLMTTSLSGQFFNFEAEYTHADELGGELTSLIDSATSHLLIRDVLVVLPGRDNVRDFLAQAKDASETDPYWIYESDGAVSQVEHQLHLPLSGTVLSFPARQGMPFYAQADIGVDGQGRSVSAVRADTGRAVPAENIWFSKRRNASGDGWEYFLNLFESDASCVGGACAYEVTYDGAPSAASLAGNVYEDINANGSQDAGEAGLAGISVTLDGSNVPRVATTGTDGTFRFADLPAGTYALTVDNLAGYYDGVATIGTANGTASGATISGVVLTSSTQATGYQFAKTPIVVQAEADLAIVGLAASTSSPRVNETFTVMLEVSNAGPDAAEVDAGVTLPSTLQVLSATPSVGAFDPATGHWVVGSLDPATSGHVQLALEVRATAEGPAAISASISPVDAAIYDPNTANNVMSLSMQVQQATEVRVTPSFARESRMLVLFGCGSINSGSSQCDTSRTALDAYLTDRSIEHFVTQSPRDFRDELRSGRWNVYWIHGGASAIDESVRNEIGLAVLRGDSLIVEGLHDTGSETLDPWIGVAYNGLRPQTPSEAVMFVSNDDLNFSGLTVSGSRQAYQVTTGTTIAKYPDNGPAIVLGLHGRGRAFLFAYDLAASLTGNGAYVPLFEQIVTATRPPIPERFSSDAFVPVAIRLENLGAAIEVDETVSVPNGARLLVAEPAPTSLALQSALWRKSLAASTTFDAKVGLRTPNVGVSSLLVDVAETGTASTLAHQELPLQVVETGKRLQIVRDMISSLVILDSADAGLRTKALANVEQAETLRANGQFNESLIGLLEASSLLDAISTVDTTEERIELAWLLQAFEREWYLALSTCTAAKAAPNRDPGLSFEPFAANQGLSMGEVAPGGFEWRLGADTKTTGRFASIVQNLTDDLLYTWHLTYGASGNGTLSLQAGTTLVNSVTYTAPAGWPLVVGNGLRLSIEALSGGGESRVGVTALDIEGTSLSDAISAAATTTPARASLYYYGRKLEDGFQATGTVKVKRPRLSSGTPPPRLSFTVHAGTLSCKRLER